MRNGLQVECEDFAGDGARGNQMLLVEGVQTANRFSVREKKSERGPDSQPRIPGWNTEIETGPGEIWPAIDLPFE